jgi:CubicO group peptidase (beta-lactamase class C family)
MTLSGEESGQEVTLLGCLAKALTCMSVLVEVSDGRLCLDDEVDAWLPQFRLPGRPSGIRIRHLLNHSHGLDMSSHGTAPKHRGDFIDCEELVARVQRGRILHEPGEIHSYGSAGTWVAAAVLEALNGVPFSKVLTSRLLGPNGITPKLHPACRDQPCASSGGGLALTLADIVSLLQRLVADSHLSPGKSTLNVALGDYVASPGWAIEKGMCLGWKCYGEGWYGHNAQMPESSLVVRFNPEARSGILICAHGPSAGIVYARMFGQLMPEVRARDTPKPLHDPVDDDYVSAIVGTYGNEMTTAVIGRGATGPTISFARSGDDPSGRFSTADALIPCTQKAFLIPLQHRLRGTWIQFLGSSSGRSRFLWNGRGVLRRTD